MTISPLVVPDWKLRTCLLCGVEPGHAPTCPAAADPPVSEYLTETLPSGVVREWMTGGARYTATVARRAAVVALMPNMTWYHAIDAPNLPMSPGLLVKEVVTTMGLNKTLASFGLSGMDTIHAPDCGCEDRWRCRCDFEDHPHRNAHPDLWADYSLMGLRLLDTRGWWVLWMLDTGSGASWLCSDSIADTRPRNATLACVMGWHHKCPGTMAPRDGETHRRPCEDTCGHTGTTISAAP